MALTKDKKQEIIEQVSGIIKDSGSVVFANFHGLSITDEQEVRQKLKDEGIRYVVVKKRLAKRALEASGVAGEIPALDGELALAYGEDQVAPARELYAFAKKHDENLKILGGIFEERYMDAAEMTTIAQIPSLKTLHAQIVNIINSPIQKLAVAVNAIAEKKEA